jgi:hypothetical protein
MNAEFKDLRKPRGKRMVDAQPVLLPSQKCYEEAIQRIKATESKLMQMQIEKDKV